MSKSNYNPADEQHRTLTEVFAKHGGSMHQDAFDAEFRKRQFGLCAWSGNSPIYMGGREGTDWACWLEKLQHAVAAGHAGLKKTCRGIVYHMPPKGT